MKFGILKATKKASMAAVAPKPAITISRTSPSTRDTSVMAPTIIVFFSNLLLIYRFCHTPLTNLP
jgi:hypothetical protein